MHTVIPQKKKNLNLGKKAHEKYNTTIKRAGIRPHNKSILNKRYKVEAMENDPKLGACYLRVRPKL